MAKGNDKGEGTRSPNYPAVGLSDALEAAGKLWTREKRTAVDNETAAATFGYKGLSGPARVMIGALRQYGLIDKTERGHFRLSDLAVDALHGTTEQKRHALKVAATTPELFRELSRTHADASEGAIQSYLVTKKRFVDSGARNAACAFRETMAVAQVESSGYNDQQDGPDGEDKSSGRDEWPMEQTTSDQQQRGPGASPQRLPDGAFVLNVPFGKGSIAVQVRVTGQAITAAHLARVRKYLELAEEDLEPSESETP